MCLRLLKEEPAMTKWILLIAASLFFLINYWDEIYRSSYSLWVKHTGIYATECRNAGYSGPCLSSKIELVAKQPWWKARVLILPPGKYEITSIRKWTQYNNVEFLTVLDSDLTIEPLK